MLDLKDFSFLENQTTFDFKGFFLKILSYWKWIVGCILLFLFIAYQINIRKEKIYALDSLIVIREETNPVLTSNTSLIFNWGGVSEKVYTITTTLKSRNHNEQVVEKLEYFIEYLKKEKYNYVDAYGTTPFYVKIDKSKPQLQNHLIKIHFINEHEYELSIEFEKDQATAILYYQDQVISVPTGKESYKKTFKIGETVDFPFLNWKLLLKNTNEDVSGKQYYVRFQQFSRVVSMYQSNIKVNPTNKNGGSILRLELEGTNKKRIEEYLNTTTEVLRQNQLETKNLFAVNTINFIDSTLVKMQNENVKTSTAIRNFVKDKNIYELSEVGQSALTTRVTQYDAEKDGIQRKIQYYKSLENYLKNSVDYSQLPAPTVAGIDDVNIISNVSQLIDLSVRRSKSAFGIKNENSYKQFDSKMESLKLVLLENIASAKSALSYDLSLVNSKIGGIENSLRKMPIENQEHTEILRKYNLEQEILANLFEKRNQAEIMKASNLSDVHFIDKAKDIGGGLIGPKTGINYVIAIFLGVLFPVLIALVITLFDNSIHNPEDVKRLSKIPIIGTLPKKQKETSNLVVYEFPKSAIAESFRTIRSSLQFMYKKQNITGAKTLMLTSSISGEGKTFCAINIATVFAMSEKKTIIVGLDLRKPKIFADFDIKNDIGCVNYLIGQKSLDQIIQKTGIPYLDTIVSGPIPPNPSELIMSENMIQMIEELQQKYDYIILDTPPVGLVSDAMELAHFSDVVLYVIRQNVTKKPMLSDVNDKHKKGELTNLNLLLNGFENKAKYGYGYGGYSNSYGYYDEVKKTSFIDRIKNIFKKQN